jgi:iron complex outermembrane receptor protein
MIRWAAFASSIFCAAAVRAQSLDYSAFEQLFGEPVTASVTGSPQRESEVPATMEIITADQIRRSGARDIPTLLRQVTGVDILRTSSDHADVGIRGYNQPFSPRLLVLVDGRQVYADYYGFTPWSAVPVELEAIRQIEVVKGPNSALFGFNAVGGVINIVTYDAVNDSINSVAVRAGTQGLGQVSAVSTWRFGDSAGLRLSAGHRDNDDFSTPMHPLQAGARRGNERSAVSLDGGFAVTDNVTVGVEGTYSDVQQAEIGPTATLGHTQYRTHSIKGHVAADTALGLIEGTLYTNEMKADIYNGTVAVPFLNFHNDVTVAQLRSISKLAAGQTLRLSLEYRDNALGTTPLPGAEVFYEVYALGGMWEWPIAERLTLTAAIRWDHWLLGRSGLVPPGFGLTNEDWDRSRTHPSFNTGAVWEISDEDTLRFMIGRGVQLPSLMNLGGFLLPLQPFGYVGGVPDLKASVVKNYEATWDRAVDALDGKLRVTAFHGRTRDIAAALGGSRPEAGLLLTATNVGNSRTSGAEVSVEGAFNERWRWGAAYTFQDVNDDLDPGAAVALTFVDFENTTPRNIVSGSLAWTYGHWEVDGFVRYQSDVDGVTSDDPFMPVGMLIPIDSYVTLDGRVGYALNDRMTVALSGQNLGRSEQQQTAAPRVERQLFASFSMQF